MPTYDVIVQGEGIRVPIDGITAVCFLRGFRISARDSVSAKENALNFVQTDWRRIPHSAINLGDPPKFNIVCILELPWWRRLKRPILRGYVFLPEEWGS